MSYQSTTLCDKFQSLNYWGDEGVEIKKERIIYSLKL